MPPGSRPRHRPAYLPFLAILAVAAALPWGVAVAAPAPQIPVPSQRQFRFAYHTVVHFPAGARQVRIWIPVAQSNRHQTVRLVAIHATVPYRLTRNARGDRMLYAELRDPKAKSARFDFVYQVHRVLYRMGDYQTLMKYNADPPGDGLPPAERAEYLRADRLVPVTGYLKSLAARVTRGQSGPVEKAHAIYLYIFHTLRYDKTGTGWGHGNAMWACDNKRGNCTDFHSLFMAMARSQGIPARFVIGFPIPWTEHAGPVEGYHCWTEFYAPGAGWVPLDIAYAWLHKSRVNFYFGAVDPSRVRFSSGRDLELAPRQSGPPVNYFVYPYIEVNGQPGGSATHRFSFRDAAR